MRKLRFAFMAAALMSLALSMPARAADLALKAAPVTGCSLTECNGFYFGANMLEQGGNFDLIGGGLNGLAQNNFSMGLQAGYEIYNGQWRLGLEVGADYGISQIGALPGGGNTKLWSADGLACIGYTLAPLFGAAATGSAGSTAATPLPAIPAALANALMSPCVLIGAWQRPWGIGFASGARASALVAKNWTVDIDYIHVNYNNANINPIVSEQSENIVRAGINYHF